MALRRFRGSKIWHLQLSVNGKIWSRSTEETNKRKAQARARDLERQAQLLRERPKRSQRLFNAMVQEVSRIESDVSESEALRAHYAFKNLASWIGKDTPLEKIDTALLERFQRIRLKSVGIKTVDRELHLILRLIRQNGFDVRKPKNKPGKETEHRPFTNDELKAFFDACLDESHRTLFLLLLCTGARPSEVIPSPRSKHVALLKKEVDPIKKTVTIRTAKLKARQPKTMRTIGIHDSLIELLQRQMERNSGMHVFSESGSLAKLFDRIIKRAGIEKIDDLGKKVTAHSFRHTHATLRAEDVSQNPFILQRLLGHRNLETTTRYTHPRFEAAVIDIAEYMGTHVNDPCEASEKTASSRPDAIAK